MNVTQAELDKIAAKAAEIQSVGGSLLSNATYLKKWVEQMTPCDDTPPPSDPGPGGGGGNDRPAGSGYVRYEDLYKAGDSVTDALKRLTEPAVVTFPEGRFEAVDFAIGGYYGIHVPGQCTGLWGSGMGAVGEQSGTIFAVKANTASKASPGQDNSTPNPYAVMFHSPAGSAVYRGFHVEGTDQRDDLMYNGLVIYGPNGSPPVDARNILSSGWVGDNGAPPGETFGMTIHGRDGHTVKDCVFDGRRAPGGPLYGLSGATSQNCVGGQWHDCHTLHVRGGAFILYQSFNIETFNWLFDRDAGDAADPNQLDGGMFNHERTSGTVHHAPVMNMANKQHGVHISHSNPSGGITIGGTYRSWEDGTLTVIDADYRNADIWGNGKLYITAWVPYGDGETNVTPPVVQSHTTPDPATFAWVRGNDHGSYPIEIIGS